MTGLLSALLGCDLAEEPPAPPPASEAAAEPSAVEAEEPAVPPPDPEPPAPESEAEPPTATAIDERLSVTRQPLLDGRFSLEYPGELSFTTTERGSYTLHDHSENVRGRMINLAIHEYPEGQDPARAEGMLAEVARLYALTQEGRIEHQGPRTVGESHSGYRVRFTTEGSDRPLYHDLLVFDADDARFYAHIVTAGRYLTESAMDHIAESFRVADPAGSSN